MTRTCAPHSRRRLRLEALEARLTPSNSPVLIADIDPGSADSSPNSFAGMGNFVYYAASTGTANGSTIGEELWRTDTATLTTALVKDVYPGGSGLLVHSSSPRNLTAVGNTLFFTATDGTTGVELWKSDGTAAGTSLVKDIRPGSNSSSPAMLTAVGNTLYFTATDATTGTELWKSDGTAAGTVEVADLTPGSTSTTFDWLKDVGGRLVFARQTGLAATPAVDVFAVDPGGPTPIVSYTGTGTELGVVVVGTRLFYHGLTPDPNVFNALDDTLFVVDTAAGSPTPLALTSVLSGAFGSPKLDHLAAVGGRLFFTANTSVGVEPWVSDGTPGGTHLVKDINQDTPQNNPGSNPTEFTDVGGIAYFAATTIAHGRELWRSDGTDQGTWEVADLSVGDTSSSPAVLINVGGHLVFDQTVDAATSKLWQYDPAAGQLVPFPTFGLAHGFVTQYPYAVYDDVLYMSPYVAGSTVGLEPYKLEFDPAAPAIAGFDADTGVPGDGVTADTTPRLFGTAPPNVRVRVYDRTTLVGSTTAGADGQWEITTVPLADGPHALRARTVNQNGTESADSNALALTIDATAPAAPAVTGFADNSGATDDNVTNDPTVTLSGTAEANATVRIADDLTVLGDAPVGADGHWSFTTAVLADGTHPFTARATDTAGNASSPSSAFPVVIDTVAPAAPTITGVADDTGVPGDGLTGDPTPTLTGTAEPGAVVAVSDGPTVLGTASAGTGGDWQFTTPSLADGPHTFTATATDVAGNASSSSSPLAASIDTARPTVTIDQSAGQADPTNASPIVFRVTFSKPVTGFTAAGVDLTSSTVGGVPAAAVTGSGTDYTVAVTGMAGEGTVVASVRAGAATDAAGNGSAASTSTDNSVRFDAVAPTVTIDQAADQPDPTDGSTVAFAVHFSEPVTGFTADDVSFAGGTGSGTLTAEVTGSGTDYAVTVTGMAGAQTVVASVPAGAAVDAAGNASLASTSTDNAVTFNDVGTLQFSLARFDTAEGTNAVVMVTRTHGSRGAISVDVATADGTAFAPADYTTESATLHWADDDTTPQSFLVPIVADGVNEGTEFINLTLSSPSDGALLGPRRTARLAIAPSDGKGPGTFTDADGDLVTVRLTPRVGGGSLLVFQDDPDGDGKGPIDSIQLSGTTARSAVTIAVTKPRGGTGDGRVGLGTVTGGDLASLSAPKADLTGDGIRLTGRLGTVRIGNLSPGSGIVAGGLATQRSLIFAGDIADGATIQFGSALGGLAAGTVGTATVTAPSAGTITVKGDFGGTIRLSGDQVVAGRPALSRLLVLGSVLPGATVTAPSAGLVWVRHDLGGDISVSGAGVLTGKPALGTLSVGGTVRDSVVSVGGNINLVTAGAFDGSRLFVGYTGPEDGVGGSFNVPAVVGTVRVTGRTNAFADSYLVATTFKNVNLMSVNPADAGTPFGIFADATVGHVTVTLPTKLKYPGQDALGDFRVEIV